MSIVGMQRCGHARGVGSLAAVVMIACALPLKAWSQVVVTPADGRGQADARAPAGGSSEAKDEDPAVVQRRAQVKQQAAHWEPQFIKLLYGDLELIRMLCGDLPRDARRAIAEDGERIAREAAVRLAELQFGGARLPNLRGDAGGRGIVIEPFGKDVGQGADDPVSFVSESLRKSLAEHAGEQQAEAFARELATRSERRKVAMVHEIVAVLDSELFLTGVQRAAIERSLLERWHDGMVGAVNGVHMVNGRRVFPGLPDACVRPHLSEAQQEWFVVEKPNVAATTPWHAQAWMRTVNLLNMVQPIERDPWWFE